MRLPDFLVIGAMKAGTTSLCRDLESHPHVFFPSVKEPHTLCLNSVLEPEGLKNYAALFRGAGPDQICGEGSTGYSKLPSHQGVPQRAERVLSKDLKLIYIVRDPVSRALSHHYHLYRGGGAPTEFMDALRAVPAITDISRYAMQIEPWLERYGLDQIHVVRFEDYIRKREQALAAAFSFLGVDPSQLRSADGTVHNAGEETLLPPARISNITRRITRSQWYKRVIHPRTPVWIRDRLKSAVYVPAPERPAPPPIEAIDYLIEQLRADWERFPGLIGRDCPLWEIDTVRAKFGDAQSA